MPVRSFDQVDSIPGHGAGEVTRQKRTHSS